MRWIVLAALLLAVILIPFALWGESLEQWVGALRWSGMSAVLAATLGVVLLAADIVLPIPSSLVGTLLGTILGAPLGTLVGAVGLTAGCVLGYAVGWTIGGSATRRFVGADQSERAAAFLERYGIAALIVCRAVPVLAEASIITAGALRLAPLRVFAATTLANVGISAVYATVGSAADDAWSFVLAFAAAMAFPAVVLIAARLAERVWRPG